MRLIARLSIQLADTFMLSTFNLQNAIHCSISKLMNFMFQVGGDPAPDIRWSRQGRERLPDGVQIVSDRGMSLHSVHPGDQGNYVCTATNKAGTITASAMLRVQVKIENRFYLKKSLDDLIVAAVLHALISE